MDSALNRQGHGDMFMVCNAGFACPDHVELIDIALSPGKPSILEVLDELKKVHAVEKIIMVQDAVDHNPTYSKKVNRVFGEGVEVELVLPSSLKELSHEVKTIIRTGDFTAWGNVLLVSGAGEGWEFEI
jgi:D-ribose pyranase